MIVVNQYANEYGIVFNRLFFVLCDPSFVSILPVFLIKEMTQPCRMMPVNYLKMNWNTVKA